MNRSPRWRRQQQHRQRHVVRHCEAFLLPRLRRRSLPSRAKALPRQRTDRHREPRARDRGILPLEGNSLVLQQPLFFFKETLFEKKSNKCPRPPPSPLLLSLFLSLSQQSLVARPTIRVSIFGSRSRATIRGGKGEERKDVCFADEREREELRN